MKIGNVMVAGAAGCAVGALAFARPTVIEGFDNFSNNGGWTFGSPSVVEATGGNPAFRLHCPVADTFAPQPRTSAAVSAWTGNLRARNVNRIGVDLITEAVDFSAAGRPLTLMLVSDNGTPGDPNDDWAAYLMGSENVPVPGEGWKRFVFDVPSRSTALPAGWQFIQFGPNSPPNPDWNAVAKNVSEVRFFYGDPTFFFIFQQWNVSLDNALVRDCPYDTNGDGVVNFAELNAVLSAFGIATSPTAPLSAGDVNGDGVVNFTDLNLVLSSFGMSCA